MQTSMSSHSLTPIVYTGNSLLHAPKDYEKLTDLSCWSHQAGELSPSEEYLFANDCQFLGSDSMHTIERGSLQFIPDVGDVTYLGSRVAEEDICICNQQQEESSILGQNHDEFWEKQNIILEESQIDNINQKGRDMHSSLLYRSKRRSLAKNRKNGDSRKMKVHKIRRVNQPFFAVGSKRRQESKNRLNEKPQLCMESVSNSSQELQNLSKLTEELELL